MIRFYPVKLNNECEIFGLNEETINHFLKLIVIPGDVVCSVRSGVGNVDPPGELHQELSTD